MHQRIVNTVHQLRQDLARHLDEKAVHEACRQAGYRWRRRLLSPAAIIHWFIIQVLHGNTALKHISLLSERTFTDSAYCQARAKLPLRIYQAVLRALIRALVPDTRTKGLWLGRHRTLLADGSAFSMPDTPELQAHFGQPGNQKPGCGFPVASMLAVFHAGTGLLLEVLAAPLRTHEMAHIEKIHPTLQPGDVLVADRGFCSFAHLALRTPWCARGDPDAPAADRRLHSGPTTLPPQRQDRRQGTAKVTLDATARCGGPGGRMVQTRAKTTLDDQGTVRGLARFGGRPRVTVPGRPGGVPDSVGDTGHHSP